MEIVEQLLHNLQQLKKIGNTDFSMKQLYELVGISDRLHLLLTCEMTVAKNATVIILSYFHFGKNYCNT